MNCPVCKAGNDQGPLCRRCRADLSLLFTLEEQRSAALHEARRCLAQDRLTEAVAAADRAEALRAGPDARRCRALAHLLQRNFAQAWNAYRRAGSS